MNAWFGFLLTLAVRFISGAVIGCVISFVFGFRVVMDAIAEARLPLERFLIWGVIGGVICMLTAPRDSWPWIKG